MPLNLHRLEIFVTVVECGGFSAAASKLYLSQPSVSHQVRQLEQSLRTVLFDRSGSRIRLTPEGEVLLDYARRVFLLTDEAITALQQVSGLQTGTLVVGGSSTVASHLLPPALAAFRDRHDGIEVGIFAGNTEQVEKRLVDGKLGIAVIAGGVKAPQLSGQPILEDRLVLVTTPGHPLAGGPEPTPDRLADERFLLREHGSSTRLHQEELLTRWGLAGAVRTAEIWGSETVKQSVAAGLGVSVVSEHCVTWEVAQRRLAARPLAAARPRPIVLAHRGDRLLGPAEQAFIELLQSMHHTWPAPLRAIS